MKVGKQHWQCVIIYVINDLLPFFEELDNEKTLKYSYYQYIGLMSDENFSKDVYKPLINQIREKCLISNEEEKEINQFFLEKFPADLKSSEMSPLGSQPNE